MMEDKHVESVKDEAEEKISVDSDSTMTLRLDDMTVFENQVGGTYPILKKEGLIFKPTRISEIEFYQNASKKFKDLLPYLAKYHGTFSFDVSKFVSVGTSTVDSSLSASSPSSSPSSDLSWAHSIFGSQRDTLESKIRKSHKEQFLVLSDLTISMKRPCVLDLKMGVRHFPPMVAPKKYFYQISKAWNSTSRRIGVRLGGMKIWDKDRQCYVTKDKQFGKTIDCDTFVKTVQQYMAVLLADDTSKGMRTIHTWIDRLSGLLSAMNQPCPFRLMSLSMLLLFDGDAGISTECSSTVTSDDDDDPYRGSLHMIDFNNIHMIEPLAQELADYRKSISSVDSTSIKESDKLNVWLEEDLDTIDQPDYGICWGINSLIHILKQIVKCHSTDSVPVAKSDEEWSQWSIETSGVLAEKGLLPVTRAQQRSVGGPWETLFKT